MQKVLSLFLSILMLTSSTGVTYAKHFCGGHEILSVITFGEKQLSCGMTMDIDSCNNKEKQENKPCCKNKYENVETDDNYTKASFDVQLNAPFIISFVSVFVLEQSVFIPQLAPLYKYYYPPPIDKDVLVLYQVFII